MTTTTKKTIQELPNDLLQEILCRVPATAFKRSRSTCKGWNRLFKDKSFARKHSDKAPKQSQILVLTNEFTVAALNINLRPRITSSSTIDHKGNLSLGSSSARRIIKISKVFHCDGLLLCNLNDEPSIVVWNPCTRETRWIQVDKRDRSFVLGYYYDQDKKSKNYKILSYLPSSKDYEIFELKSDSWRVLDGNNDITPVRPIGYSGHSGQIVSLKGKTYWFGVDQTRKISLLRFDYSTEKSKRFPLPYHQSFSYETANLSVVKEEKLSVLLHRGTTSKVEIWVTNKIDDDETSKVVMSWSKVLALDSSSDLQISDFGSFLLDEEKKVLMYCERIVEADDVDHDEEADEEEEANEDEEAEMKYKDMIYIVGEDNKVIKEHCGTLSYEAVDHGSVSAILNYVPSLVQIQQAAGGKRKRGPKTK